MPPKAQTPTVTFTPQEKAMVDNLRKLREAKFSLQDKAKEIREREAQLSEKILKSLRARRVPAGAKTKLDDTCSVALGIKRKRETVNKDYMTPKIAQFLQRVEGVKDPDAAAAEIVRTVYETRKCEEEPVFRMTLKRAKTTATKKTSE